MKITKTNEKIQINCDDQIFNRLQNHEDSSNFDAFGTELITSTQSIISEMLRRQREIRVGKQKHVDDKEITLTKNRNQND